MKKFHMRWLASAVIVAGSIGFLAGAAFTDDPASKGGMPDEAEMAKMMEMMTELAKPGPEHRQIARMAGDWDVVAKFWMAGPEPQVSKASSTNKMTLGGRFLTYDYAGSFGDTPFEGRGVLAFNNFQKKYESIWYDNFSSGLSLETGSLSDDGKTLAMAGSWDGPMGKMPVRHVYSFQGKDKYTLTGYSTMGGEEMRSMELTFTRRKAAAAAVARPADGRCCPPGSRGPGY